MARARIGSSGWQYDHWRKVFYPAGLGKQEWFAYYARHFDTVEINNTFYRLPEAEVFERWREEAPEGFLCTLKFSRYGSHFKRLLDPGASIELFLERALCLEEKLGPVLVQLPPRWKVNRDRLAAFLEAAPGSQRWTFEFRDPSWLCGEVFTLLREHNAALCIHDMIAGHPQVVTADWVYLRFHGVDGTGNYSPRALDRIASAIRDHLTAGQDVFAYFNNDACGHAVRNAADLLTKVCPP